MNWIALLASFGAGAVVVKVLDFGLAHIQERIDQRRWLRETRLRSFTKLAEGLLPLGLNDAVHGDMWRFQSLSAEAQLLIENDALVKKLRRFLFRLFVYNQQPEDNSPGRLAEFMDLENEAIELVDGLRKELLPRPWWSMPEEYGEVREPNDDALKKVIQLLRQADAAKTNKTSSS